MFRERIVATDGTLETHTPQRPSNAAIMGALGTLLEISTPSPEPRLAHRVLPIR